MERGIHHPPPWNLFPKYAHYDNPICRPILPAPSPNESLQMYLNDSEWLMIVKLNLDTDTKYFPFVVSTFI